MEVISSCAVVSSAVVDMISGNVVVFSVSTVVCSDVILNLSDGNSVASSAFVVLNSDVAVALSVLLNSVVSYVTL